MPCTRAFVLPRWPSADLPGTSSTCDLTGQDIADCPRPKTVLSGLAAISRRAPLPTRRRNRLIDRRCSARGEVRGVRLGAGCGPRNFPTLSQDPVEVVL